MIQAADLFVTKIANDPDFNYLSHNRPSSMLGPEWEIYVEIIDGEIVAWSQIESFPDRPTKQHVCKIGFIVLPEWRGQGYGTGLLVNAIQQCRKYSKIVAHVYSDNLVMLGMFLRKGFVIEGFYRNEVIYNGQFRHVISLARHQGVES